MFARQVRHTLCGIALLGVLATASTSAVVSPNRTTFFTFNGAVQLPGVVLPAGTYIFEVVNPYTSADVVRVQSRDRSKLYLLQITLKAERPRTRDMKPALVFGERPAGNPPTLKSWFPEGETTGRQFIY
jgi:hypothetical protein